MLRNESFSDILGNINTILTEIFKLIIISFVKCFASKPTDVVYIVHTYNAVGVYSNLPTGLSFMLTGLRHPYKLDESISNFRIFSF